MSPILGITAAQITGKLTSYDSIATVSLATSALTISFTSIPSTYQHLQLRLFSQTDQSNYNDGVIMKFNGDTGQNYTLHWMYGDGANVSSLNFASYGGIRAGQTAGNVNQPNPTYNFGGNITDLLDYSNTNKYKTVRSLGGANANGVGQMMFVSGVWMNTAAISSIVLEPTGSAFGFKPYTHAALYGIR
jgi:hypothetical protein